MMEFHISRNARDRYKIKETLFSFSGNVVFANLADSRELAHRMNEERGAQQDPSRAVNPGALYAMGLIDEASHALIAHYRENVDANVMNEALDWFAQQVGEKPLDDLLLAFVNKFPSTAVYRGEIAAAKWLEGSTGNISHRAAALEELLLLWAANANPAFAPFKELFDDADLATATVYPQVTASFSEYFATKPPIGPGMPSLFDMLRAPALASPDSLSGQLAFIRTQWSVYVGDILRDLLLASDILREEEVAIWMRFHPPSSETMHRRHHADLAGDQHSEVPQFATTPQEYERFSPDQDWMPTTVLLAKSTYVWLAQLTKQYGRPIQRLNEIPDEELDTLRRRGMNGLWLIGIWERSRASRSIKRLCGNEDAVASAYSLYDYTIAHDLGGEEAYRNLRDRAQARGVRLASDMVPNHMGIDSSWVINHPEWFLSRPDCPYPAYKFEGPDLSGDDRVEIKIEDHYYEQTDAAVVFQRRDKWTGDTRYVYHGNDGTSFPWNDTAQLNYLSAAVREQVIQTILHVARLFPIIRFDAAMTLAKRHIQRLWFPAPGSGGAIPSRAECGMTTAEFDAAIPQEFWREVVDRVAAEVPGTLLLAEAFWLMEGYFVRTLGMHRVYNSAFMNMMRDEDNAKYRQVLKNTLEFDPGIMKRYVNFMSNPDEKTAVEQFGTGDKYFGVATMMATLPGLPMFGHGQVEGYTEKYGMEYYRPRYDETPNGWLVDRHQREIAPLLHNRALFAESDDFLLYDFWKDDGTVDENVFAYSNRRGSERALVIYHNKFASTRGTIHHSAAYWDKPGGSLRQRNLQEGLALPVGGSVFLAFRNSATGLEYLRRASDLVSRGFHIDLQAYQYAALLHWRELTPDAEHPWDRLHDVLQGAGVENLDDSLLNLELTPVHETLLHFLSPEGIAKLANSAGEATIPAKKEPSSGVEDPVLPLLRHGLQFIEEARKAYFAKTGMAQPGGAVTAIKTSKISEELQQHIRALVKLPELVEKLPTAAYAVLPGAELKTLGPALAWAAVGVLARSVHSSDDMAHTALALLEKLRLRHVLAKAFAMLGMAGEDSWRAAARVRVAFTPAAEITVNKAPAKRKPSSILGFAPAYWQEPDFRWLIGLHEAEGHHYFNKESHEEMLWWSELPTLLALAEGPKPKSETLRNISGRIEAAAAEARRAGYRFVPEATLSPLAVPKTENKAKKIVTPKKKSKSGKKGATSPDK